jgi:hypothetical protein
MFWYWYHDLSTYFVLVIFCTYSGNKWRSSQFTIPFTQLLLHNVPTCTTGTRQRNKPLLSHCQQLSTATTLNSLTTLNCLRISRIWYVWPLTTLRTFALNTQHANRTCGTILCLDRQLFSWPRWLCWISSNYLLKGKILGKMWQKYIRTRL